MAGKVALITGAGNGMGQATAKLFAEEGAQVLAVDYNEASLEQWQNVENVAPVLADITKLEDIERMIGLAETQFGRLDCVCNIAGINDLLYPLLETTDERWDNVLDLDLKAPFRISRRAVKTMLEQESGGVIVNVGSYAALRGNHGPSYSAAKHGLMGLTLAVAAGYAEKGIRCNAINPGGVKTNIGEHSGGEYHKVGMERLMWSTGSLPVPYADPIEIARTALFLCSDEAKHVNGAMISVDAGLAAF